MSSAGAKSSTVATGVSALRGACGAARSASPHDGGSGGRPPCAGPPPRAKSRSGEAEGAARLPRGPLPAGHPSVSNSAAVTGAPTCAEAIMSILCG